MSADMFSPDLPSGQDRPPLLTPCVAPTRGYIAGQPTGLIGLEDHVRQ